MTTSGWRQRLHRFGALLHYLAIPLLVFAGGVALLLAVGVAQRFGWLPNASSGSTAVVVPAGADVDYICPMMCVPPRKEPGKCPVCEMDLVPATGGGTSSDGRSIVVDPASRRIAHIQTAVVQRRPVERVIRAVGELQYDEGSLKTITAYTAGRIEELFVDYTGAVVRKGDALAVMYSPALHAAQVEFLQTTRSDSVNTSLPAIAKANRLLRQNARQKLVELGMSETQIDKLTQAEQPDSRIRIPAPLAGTVTERMVSEGQTVRDGEPLFRLADLSSVWLMLQLFPEDASAVRYGQRVDVSLKSIPSETFSGRIAFVDPDVDPKTRTVSVRVVMNNEDGRLRIGDYARAEISVPVGASGQQQVFDPELADKWISPRHPHIVSDMPGQCPVCGEDLVAAAEMGFTDVPPAESEPLVVPRNAVLQAAGHSVVYVEEEPGRFAIRRVITGPTVGDEIVIERGLAAEEKVATRGNFLLDSQMQLAGNPSLIDPARAAKPQKMVPGFDATMLAAIRQLPEDDQPAALSQVICPVTKLKLGSMGVPPKVSVSGKEIYLCCEGCRKGLLTDPNGYIDLLETMKADGTLQSPMAADPAEPDLPQIGVIEDAVELPPIEGIQMLPEAGPMEPAEKDEP